jgi:uncharacterized membrane protein YjgN (DUF898 family)
MVDATLAFAPAGTEPAPSLPEPAGRGVPIGYDGSAGELFRLWLRLTPMTLATLGFYRFWATTRYRRYLWSRVTLDGEPFEYDGTGKELFRRFLAAAVIVLPIAFAPQFILALGFPEVARAVSSATALVMLSLAYLAYYGARRYRLSRTRWHGIRGRLEGSAGRYCSLALRSGALVVLTLGLQVPWRSVRLWDYEINNAGFGSRPFSFEGRGRDLLRRLLASFGVFLLSLVVLVPLALVLPFGLDLAVVGAVEAGVAAFLPLLLFFAAALFMPLAVALPRAYWEAGWLRYRAERTRFGRIAFSSTATVRGLLWLRLSNHAMLLLSLGLLGPFAEHRTLAYLTRHIRASGPLDADALRQDPASSRPKAEGLAQFIETDGLLGG